MIEYYVSKVIEVDANTTKKEIIVNGKDTRVLIVKEILMHFPTGSNYTLQVVFNAGLLTKIPVEGYFTGDNLLLPIKQDVVIEPNSKLEINITNTDASNSHKLEIIVKVVELTEEEYEEYKKRGETL